MTRFSLTLILLPIVSMAAAVCKESPYNECGCPRRGTFDNAYLEKEYPAIITKYPGFTFYAPTVTYPNCSMIVSNCPQDGSTMVALINNQTDVVTKINAVTISNPYNTGILVCSDEHEWIAQGAGSIQPLLDSYKLGCKKAN